MSTLDDILNPRALYNEIEPYAVQWLRNLEGEGLIAHGAVEDRSIRDLVADDVRGYTQAHFFAGIGIWQLALSLAGWPDELPVWTGSCPCQPFSTAGAGKGVDDDRHLWPEWFRLIRQCRPPIIFGEQVASADGLEWLDIVCADLEGAGYSVGAADLCAAGVGAPHIRQRLYFVAYANEQLSRLRLLLQQRGPRQDRAEVVGRRQARKLGNAYGVSDQRHTGGSDSAQRTMALGRLLAGELDHGISGAGSTLGVGHTAGVELQESRYAGSVQSAERAYQRIRSVGPGATRGFWHPADWILCRPEPGREAPRWRPVEPGTFPLADGDPARMGKLRAYGNAICAPLAQEFVESVIEILSE